MTTTKNVSSKTKYIVKRNGIRVSEVIYNSKKEAMAEYNHWKKIIKRWPDGSQLEISTI